MKKFIKVVDSSGVTHQFAATDIASLFKDPVSDRITVEYKDGNSFTLTASSGAYTDADTSTFANAIIALNESKWTSVVDTVTLSVAPTVVFTFA